MANCWMVVFSNYDPFEVDTIWSTRELAEKRADKLNDLNDESPWTIQKMAILSDPSELKEGE